jgi:uncharacterized protein (DUF302 family)
VIIRNSRLSYAQTLSILKQRITDGGGTIFASIDQAEAAAAVGLTLRPTTLLVFGNPKGGTPVMEAFPLVALELPLKLLVWEESGKVSLAYVPMSEIAKRYGATGIDAQIDAMDRAVDILTSTVE